MIWINSIIGHITSSLLAMSSREYKTIARCSSQFATALHSDRDIPHHLHAEENSATELPSKASCDSEASASAMGESY